MKLIDRMLVCKLRPPYIDSPVYPETPLKTIAKYRVNHLNASRKAGIRITVCNDGVSRGRETPLLNIIQTYLTQVYLENKFSKNLKL